MSFELVVDEYTSLQPKGAYNVFATMKLDTVIMLQANAQTPSSDYLTYLINDAAGDPTKNKVIPIYSAVVRLENGKVSELVWDNGCFECTGQLCNTETTKSGKIDSNCFSTTSCAINGTDSANCDPKIYVSFMGTDRDGVYLTSAGMRISRFRQFSIKDMYNSAKNTYNSASDTVKTNWNKYVKDNKDTYNSTSRRILNCIDDYLVQPIRRFF